MRPLPSSAGRQPAPTGQSAIEEGGLSDFVCEYVTKTGFRPALRRPPRLIVRTLSVIFGTVAPILAVVFVLYGLAPLGTPVSATTVKAAQALGLVAALSLVLAASGSVLLARRLTSPISEISRSLSAAIASRDLGLRLQQDGSSRELDLLIKTFNSLMASLSKAEEETQIAYVGVIQALAVALDARDHHTAGHSKRVSELSVFIGRRMGMPDQALEVLRLGALLHDIGKIGISDAVLRKPGPLTDDERLAIRSHPAVGARILQPIARLAPHVPIVELHHERPDGRGFPHGLKGNEIPLAARIVRVADAFDAITSDRPYRPAGSPRHAIAEIVTFRGSQFDAAVVDAFLAVMRESARGLVTDHDEAVVKVRRGSRFTSDRQLSATLTDERG